VRRSAMQASEMFAQSRSALRCALGAVSLAGLLAEADTCN
jgi:hypothetical protein